MKRLFAGTVLTAFITTYMGNSLTVAILVIEQEFQVSSNAVGWIVTIYMIASAVFCLFFGKAADEGRRKTFLTVGVGLFTISSAAAAFSNVFWLLLLFRFLQGVGAAMIFSTNVALAAEAAGRDNRGKAIGIITASNYAGMAAGPAAGGLVTDIFSWRGIFISAALLGILIMVILFSAGRSGPAESDKPEPEKKLIPQKSWKTLIKNSIFSYAAILTAINYGACYVVTYLFTSYLQVLMGFSSRTTGFILITAPVIQACLSPAVGKMSDKYRAEKIIIFGLMITGISMILAGWFLDDAGLIPVIGVQVAVGTGAALFTTSNVNFALGKVSKDEYSMATAILAAMRSAGHIIGIAISGIIISMYIGNDAMNTASDSDVTGIVRTVFTIMGILCILGTGGKILLEKYLGNRQNG